MGQYIETTNGATTQKAIHFMEDHGAQGLPEPQFIDPATGKVAVCVVSNGPFEAAAVAYDEEEFRSFLSTARDNRPRTWIVMDCKTAARLGSPALAGILGIDKN
jgi:hypothetical protein